MQCAPASLHLSTGLDLPLNMVGNNVGDIPCKQRRVKESFKNNHNRSIPLRQSKSIVGLFLLYEVGMLAVNCASKHTYPCNLLNSNIDRIHIVKRNTTSFLWDLILEIVPKRAVNLMGMHNCKINSHSWKDARIIFKRTTGKHPN